MTLSKLSRITKQHSNVTPAYTSANINRTRTCPCFPRMAAGMKRVIRLTICLPRRVLFHILHDLFSLLLHTSTPASSKSNNNNNNNHGGISIISGGQYTFELFITQDSSLTTHKKEPAALTSSEEIAMDSVTRSATFDGIDEAQDSTVSLESLSDTKTELHETKQRVCLTNLDDLVLRRVCDFLLSTSEVKKLPKLVGGVCKPTYDFQSAILRTCKTLHHIGKAALASNHLILISSKSETIFNGIPVAECIIKLYTKNIRAACDIRMHLLFEAEFEQPKVMQSGLLFLDDFEAFMVGLKRIKLLIDPRMSLVMQFKSMCSDHDLPPKVQQAIVAPLAWFHGSGVNCVIRGNVDHELARKHESAINLKIGSCSCS